MASDKDYYKILGINSSASKDEVKKAYRKLARKYHPDVNTGNKLFEEKFKEIGEAYAVLADDDRRKKFDLLNGYTERYKQPGPPPNTVKQQAKSAYTQTSKPKEPQKEQSGPAFSDIFEGIFKKAQQTQTQKKQEEPAKKTLPPQRGDDITVDVSISITEAHNGAERKINVLHTQVCGACKGKKFINGSKCRLCEGTGQISEHKKITVKVPPNVKEGSKVRVPKEGNRGENGGESGDLFLMVHIQKHSLFEFEGLNVLCDIPITPTEAALGASIEVPTVEGFVSMKIPSGTTSGQKFRLNGEGIVDSRTKNRGDHIVTVKIDIPKNLSEKEKELYRELEKIRKFNPRESLIFDTK